MVHPINAHVSRRTFSTESKGLTFTGPSRRCTHSCTYLSFSSLQDSSTFSSRLIILSPSTSSSAFISIYAILTVLPNLILNSPYRTPLSGLVWRISQVSVLAILLIIRRLEGSLHERLSSYWSYWHRTNRNLAGLRDHSPLGGERSLNLRSARIETGLFMACGCFALLEHH